jgi:Undecaprenyl-phosphate glucose phosphotransferase
VILVADRDELRHTDPVNLIRRAGYLPAATLTYDSQLSADSLQDLVDNAVRLSREQPIDSVMLLGTWREPVVIDSVAAALRILPLSVHLLPDHRTARLLQHGTGTIAGVVSAQVQRSPLSKTERALKRAFDLLVASVSIILLLPLFSIVALLIKADSTGPVFFHQRRVGFNGRDFRIYKFRSMNVAEDDSSVRQATRDDPRLTRLGRWLRKTIIDELPQLWNVLKGEMSIVGPRPHAVAHDVQYQPVAHDAQYQRCIGSYAFRHHVKPGLTGWAQVNGLRGETKTVDLMERRVEHDLYYINHWTFFLDLLIVLLTIRRSLRDPAAF